MHTTGWERTAAQDHLGMQREHGSQLQLLDGLEQALLRGGGGPGALEALEELLDVSDVHFASEETMMRLHAYPGYAAHVEEHRRMVEALQEVRAQLVHGDGVLERVRDVRRWLSGHMAGMDDAFARHLALGAGAGHESHAG
ncbi:MAG: hemerythrin family protein [Anaeromyxobacter sp.]